MRTREISIVYGSQDTPDTAYLYEQSNGLTWYCVDGSVNVNCTHQEIEEGQSVEEIHDIDCFTWSKPIESLEELEEAVEN